MFFVFNKQKIYTYLVSIVTVVLLFCVAGGINNQSAGTNTTNAIQTASQATKLLPIYNVQTEEKKVAFTMNCAW